MSAVCGWILTVLGKSPNTYSSDHCELLCHFLVSLYLLHQAEVQGFKINLSEVVPRQNTNVQKLLEAFPRSNGKIPALQSADMKLTEVPAIAVV